MVAPCTSVAHRLFGLALLAGLAWGTSACDEPNPPVDYIAQVGDSYLMEEDLRTALADMPAVQDTSGVRRQLVDQWVTNELLYQEALRLNLLDNEDVQRRLEESERAVLIDALVSSLYAAEAAAVSTADLRSYFERHREQLRLREPFLRVRYLATSDPDSAALARRLLVESERADQADSVWTVLARRFADDPDGALLLAATYFPESRLLMDQRVLRDRLTSLSPRQVAPVLETDSTYHVLQLVDRVPAGAIPELAWIEDEVRRLLTIDARKQMFQRLVQRLRTEAQARDAFVVR